MCDTPQIDAGRLDLGDRLARMFIGLADHLRLLGRHTDATLLINWAYQLFDADPARGVACYSPTALEHSNDNSKNSNSQAARRLHRLAFPNSSQSTANQASTNQIAANSLAACARTRSRSNEESVAPTYIPGLSHVGGTLRRLVLFTRTT